MASDKHSAVLEVNAPLSRALQRRGSALWFSALCLVLIVACSEAESAEETTEAADGGGNAASDSADTEVTANDSSVEEPESVPPSSNEPIELPLDPEETPIGWAAVAGLERETTTGGAPFMPVRVTTMTELQDEAESPLPRVILLDGQFTGRLDISSHKTLIGAPGALFHGTIVISGAQNIVLRNLTVQGNNCTDSPTDCSDGSDAINVRGSHHLWFDHLDVSDGSDGNLDITEGSDFVTVSWSKFSYSTNTRNHRFSNLIGAADNNPVDEGHLNVTWHHNWWTGYAQQRMPRVRYGQVHVFNNLYSATDNDSCIAAGMNASVLIESNIFSGVQDPHTQMTASGNLLPLGNVYTATSGDVQDTGVAFTPPYDYELEATSSLEELIMAEAGPLK